MEMCLEDKILKAREILEKHEIPIWTNHTGQEMGYHHFELNDIMIPSVVFRDLFEAGIRFYVSTWRKKDGTGRMELVIKDEGY